MSPESDPQPVELLPLKPADLQLLLVLADGDLHGYGLMKAVEEESGGRVRLEVGSLYRVIGRLLRQGLIAESDDQAEADDARRRRYYRITELGRRVTRAEMARLAEVIETGKSRNLAGGA